jgi:hypothetical protein
MNIHSKKCFNVNESIYSTIYIIFVDNRCCSGYQIIQSDNFWIVFITKSNTNMFPINIKFDNFWGDFPYIYNELNVHDPQYQFYTIHTSLIQSFWFSWDKVYYIEYHSFCVLLKITLLATVFESTVTVLVKRNGDKNNSVIYPFAIHQQKKKNKFVFRRF